MDQKKKVMLGTMVMALALGSSLAGCSNDGGSASNTESPAASDSKPAAATAKPYVRGDISVSIYDRAALPSGEGTIDNNRWTKWLNEKGPANVKFIPVPRWESQQKLNVLFASGSAPDLVFEYNPLIKNTFYDQKMMMPIDEMIEKYSTEYKQQLKEYPELKKVGMKSDGKLYEFGRFSEVVPIHVVLVRNDWLKKLNLQAPKTTDELFEVAKAFAEKDPDGNGKKDTYGVNLSGNAQHLIKNMFKANNWVLEKDQLVREWDYTKMAIEYSKKFFDAGIVDKDFINDKDGTKASQEFINGKMGIYFMTNMNWKGFAVNSLPNMRKNDPTAELTVIPMPKSPAGQFNYPTTNPVQAVSFVNAKASNPEAVMKYVDFLTKQDTAKTLQYGLEGTHYNIGDNGCPKEVDPVKTKNEVSAYGDFTMMSSLVLLDKKCGMQEAQFNVGDPNQKDVLGLQKLAISYIDPSKDFSTVTHPEHLPGLPKDLQQIEASTKQALQDLYNKGIIGGDKFTPEQAIKEAQSTWEKAGGKQVDDFFAKWYADNKNTAFLNKDILAVEKKQHAK
jgi:putative aldouronate transport system substrate-binding protein